MPNTKRSRVMLGLVTCFFWASQYCHVPFLTPYLKSLGLTATVIGFLVGCYGFTQLCIRVPIGLMADIKSCYRTIVIVGCFFTTTSTLGLYLTQHIVLVFFFRVLAGVAASTWVGFTILYTGYFSPEEGSRAIAQINGFNNTGKLLAFILGSVTAMYFGYRAPFLMSFSMGVIAIALSFFVDDVKVKRKAQDIRGLFLVFKDFSVIVPALLAIFQQMILQATAFSFTSDIAKNIGATPAQIGINSTIFTIAQIVTAGFVGTSVTKKIGDRKMITLCFLGLAAYCVLTCFSPNIYFLYVTQFIGGFCNATLFAMLMANCIRYVAPEKKSTSMGFFQAVYGLGMTIGPILMGGLVDTTGYQGAFTIFGGVGFMASILSFFLIPMVAKRFDKQEAK